MTGSKTERDDSMALADYTVVGDFAAYYFHNHEGNLTPMVVNSNSAIYWLENVLCIMPKRDIYSNFTYYLNDEEIAMFILRWE